MLSLSLSPRFDLYRFMIPKDFIPEEVRAKYDKILSQNAGVFTDSVDYLNESIQAFSFPGVVELINEQTQVSYNTISRIKSPTNPQDTPGLLGRINVEPAHVNTTYNSGNPLDKISHECKIKFRQNQGLYNYWMIYETILKRFCKPELYENAHEMFKLEILDEIGVPVTVVNFYQPKISGLDGLEFDYSKLERQTDFFECAFVYNNVDIDFCVK